MIVTLFLCVYVGVCGVKNRLSDILWINIVVLFIYTFILHQAL